MSGSYPFKCVLIGGKSLIIKCADLLLEGKHKILTIISDEAAVYDWAKLHNIEAIPLTQDNLKTIERYDFDYLFSIANLKVLPEPLIQRPAKLAINFHDGPLPDYAGINVPAWAIMNHEHKHAISWHVMTNELDNGDILVSLPVPITDHETSLSLNTKCFDIGIQGFQELISNIEDNSLEPIQQRLENHNYYAKCKRPAAASTILWNQSAEDIDSLVRGLDYGPYWNPIGFPKLYLGNSTSIVKKIEISDKISTTQPGTVLCVEPGLLISTSTFDIKIIEITSFDGQELLPSELAANSVINVSEQLPSLSTEQIDKLSAYDRESCKHEEKWIKDLSILEPLELPFSESKSGIYKTTPYACLSYSTPESFKSLSTTPSGDKLAQSLMLYFSKLCQKDYYSIAFNDIPKQLDNIHSLYFEQKLPLNIKIDHNNNSSIFFKIMAELFEEHRCKSSYSHDLTLRDPNLSTKYLQHSSDSLSICIFRTTNIVDVNFELTGDFIIIIPDDGKECIWHYNDKALSSESIKRMQDQFTILLNEIVSKPQAKLQQLSIITKRELDKIYEWNKTDFDYVKTICIHQLFEQQVAKTPDQTALSFQGEDLSYADLNVKANQIAHLLLENDIKPDNLVGILVNRSSEMVITMLGVLKAGAAYLPLDPTYPDNRINFMLEDGKVSALITKKVYATKFPGTQNTVLIDNDIEDIVRQPLENPVTEVNSNNLAYTIYTSGSTGKPKGVMVEHKNVINFFVGMDKRIGSNKPGVWLAATSISFDISVLELFWTLARGFQVVIYSDTHRNNNRNTQTKYPSQDIQFSLFYWNVADDESDYDDEKYRLLIESTKYGDKNKFSAVWTPERHFHAFGGLYPNPSVTSAALATITDNIQIRAGSCVLPLHHPIRVVEEWSMVDNFSNGRIGLAIAAGWQPNDFVIMPNNHAEAKTIMFESIEQVKKLWRGETLEFPGPKGDPVQVRTLPRPIQKELPIWVTTAGNPETFKLAGEIGANILTHLLGQSVEDVAKNLNIYREAYKAAGHDGEGEVTLLLHTLVGPDNETVKEIARTPMKNYLKSAMFLVKAAAWHFPTFKDFSNETGKTLDEYFATIADEDLDSLLEFAFERYFTTSGLFGTPESCLKMIDKLKEIGVTEIGCLIDYGIATDTVLKHLPYLNKLRQIAGKAPPSSIQEEASIPDLIQRYGVTHFQCTPSMASMLTAEPNSQAALKSLQCMMVGGEALPPTLAQKLTGLVGGRLINMYGPTETTIWSTTQQISVNDQVSIGRPIANTTVYVLDNEMQFVPIGVPGELYIGGDGVTRGYLNRPEITAERFLNNPFNNSSHQMLYKTGDLVRYRPDGTLDYIGRTDFQVKIRGYRIELGEIEALLGQHPNIRDAVAIVREDIPGDLRLVAYVVPKEENPGTSEQLRTMLRDNLPEHMVPANIISLQQLPLTPNDKIDRKALPLPTQEKPDSAQVYQAPRTSVEEVVADLWCEVLGLNKSGIHEQFFDLGGHSLLATQIIAQLRKTFHVELPLHTIFAAPTIAGLTQALINNEKQPGQIESIANALKLMQESSSEEDEQAGRLISVLEEQGIDTAPLELSIVKYPVSEKPPLSYGQQRLWFLDKLEPGSHYNDAFSLHLRGDLDVDALEMSINQIISRHEVLRTVFATAEGEPYQVIYPDLHLQLDQIDLREIPKTQRSNKIQTHMTEQIGFPIDLANGPVLRTTLYRLDDNEYLFLLVIHQIANDSWSLGIFMDELWKLYLAFIDNNPSPLPELTIQYTDYAQWQRRWFESGVIDKELTYWIEKLSGDLPILDLPTDHPRPATQCFKGARYFITLSDEIVDRLKKLSAESSCTPFITLLTVFKVLLFRYTAQTDIIVGAPIANRDRQEMAPLIGMFINNLILRTDLSGDPTFRQLLMKVLQTTTEAYDHPNVPFESLVEVLHPERDLSRTPLFQVMFDYQNTPLKFPKLSKLAIEPQAIDGKMSRLDLTFELSETSEGIKGHWEYNTDLFAPCRIERMAKHFQNLLAAALKIPDQHLSELPLLSEAEQKQLVVDWNTTQAPYPSDKGIHQLFEQQARLTPDTTALIMGGETLSYRQLNQQANLLATHLRSIGVEGNSLVGICVERSLEMVVAMLGILKAGAAYLPLDPSYPEERIAYMLEDSQSSIVITHGNLSQRLSNFGVTVISLVQPLNGNSENPDISLNSDNLAYIIYTSGSTGKPKGVEVPHRSVVNFLCSMQREPGIQSSDVLLAVTTISFDISVLEIFLPLISGASVVIADRDTTMDGKQLSRLLSDTDVSIMQATPATWRLLLTAGWKGSEKIKALCGGEAMPTELIKELVPRAGGGLWNMYGPTETTIWSTCYRLKEANDSPLIGRPIANTRIHILDNNMQPVPIGIPGEVYIGGDGVVRGYHKRPELTADRFVRDPLTNTNTARLYKTGDLARYCEDGNIEYLRRIDNQVKVRGFRIELGEIETSLVSHDAIRQAVVTVHEERPGDKRLVSYVVYETGTHATISELRKYLKERLPDYMVPAMYIDVQSLPLTPSGKVDRNALPNPFQQYAAADSYLPPRNEIEKRIASIWKDALHVEQIGVHDNFFDLGGHSLLSMQVIARIEKQTGCIIGPRAMVMDTLEQIASTCPKEAKENALIERDFQQYEHSGSFIGKILRIFTRS